MVLMEIQNLKTYYFLPDYVIKAVDGVSMKIEEGEIIGERNSAIGKSWFRTDIRIEKGFSVFSLNPEVYIDVKNLFNTKNARKINPITGRPYEPGEEE